MFLDWMELMATCFFGVNDFGSHVVSSLAALQSHGLCDIFMYSFSHNP